MLRVSFGSEDAHVQVDSVNTDSKTAEQAASDYSSILRLKISRDLDRKLNDFSLIVSSSKCDEAFIRWLHTDVLTAVQSLPDRS